MGGNKKGKDVKDKPAADTEEKVAEGAKDEKKDKGGEGKKHEGKDKKGKK